MVGTKIYAPSRKEMPEEKAARLEINQQRLDMSYEEKVELARRRIRIAADNVRYLRWRMNKNDNDR